MVTFAGIVLGLVLLIVGALRGETGIALGNVIGSNTSTR